MEYSVNTSSIKMELIDDNDDTYIVPELMDMERNKAIKLETNIKLDSEIDLGPVQLEERQQQVQASDGSCNCAKQVKLLTEQITSVLSKLDALQDQNNVLQTHISTLVEAISEQKATIWSLVHRRGQEVSLGNKFPISSSEEMTKMESEINSDNKEIYKATIVNFLRPEGVSKQLKNILTDSVVMAHNVDGVHGKLPLKNYKNLYSTLIAAITASGGHGPAEDQLRKAMQLQKKRILKRSYVPKISAHNKNNIV